MSHLCKSPLLVLLLEPRHDNRDDCEWVLEHVVGDFAALLGSVYLLEHPLVDRGALPAQPSRHLEVGPFRGRQREHLLCDRLQELYALLVRLDVEVVVVPLFFDAMQTLLVGVLPMSDEARVLGCPGRVRGPLIVEY